MLYAFMWYVAVFRLALLLSYHIEFTVGAFVDKDSHVVGFVLLFTRSNSCETWVLLCLHMIPRLCDIDHTRYGRYVVCEESTVPSCLSYCYIEWCAFYVLFYVSLSLCWHCVRKFFRMWLSFVRVGTRYRVVSACSYYTAVQHYPICTYSSDIINVAYGVSSYPHPWIPTFMGAHISRSTWFCIVPCCCIAVWWDYVMSVSVPGTACVTSYLVGGCYY